MRTVRSSSYLLGVGGLPQCMLRYPLGVALETPRGVGLEAPRCEPGDPPWIWAWRPPGQTPQPQLRPWVWAWNPPRPDPSTSPLGVELETPPQARPLDFQPGCGPEDLQGMLVYHLPTLETCKACWDTTCNACWDTIPPEICKACWDTTHLP